jgi:hypothetical protein
MLRFLSFGSIIYNSNVEKCHLKYLFCCPLHSAALGDRTTGPRLPRYAPVDVMVIVTPMSMPFCWRICAY